MIAGLLAISAIPRYRFLSAAVFVEFAGHKIIYEFGIVETDILNPYLIYLAYAALQVIIIAYLYLCRSHFIIAALIGVNLIVNLLSVMEFFSEFISIHYAYAGVVGSIMVIELMYLGAINHYVNDKLHNGRVNSYDHIDRIFRVRHGRASGGVL